MRWRRASSRRLKKPIRLMTESPASPSEDRIAILETELVRLRESERRYRFSAALAARLVWVADAGGNMSIGRAASASRVSARPAASRS